MTTRNLSKQAGAMHIGTYELTETGSVPRACTDPSQTALCREGEHESAIANQEGISS